MDIRLRFSLRDLARLAAVLITFSCALLSTSTKVVSEDACAHDPERFALGSPGNAFDEIRATGELELARIEDVINEGLACDAFSSLYFSSYYLMYQPDRFDQAVGITALSLLARRGSSQALLAVGIYMTQNEPTEALITLYLARACAPTDPYLDKTHEPQEGDDSRSMTEIRDSAIQLLEEMFGPNASSQMEVLAEELEPEFCA